MAWGHTTFAPLVVYCDVNVRNSNRFSANVSKFRVGLLGDPVLLAKVKKLIPKAIRRFLYKCECKGERMASGKREIVEDLTTELELISQRPPHIAPTLFQPIEDQIDVSIIIPVYNAEKYLDCCVCSCLSQITDFKFEIIAVDDGSTDASPSMLDKFASDSRLKVIHQSNLGHAGARNAALDAACGRYVCFVDSDDFIPIDALQRLMSRAVEIDADIVGGGYWICDVEGRRRRFKGLHSAVYTTPIAGLSGLPWGSIYRRSLWDGVRFPEGFWFEDTCMPYLIFSRSMKTASITGSVYYYRANPEGITATSASSKKSLDSIWVVMEMLDEMQRLGIDMTPVLYEQTLRQFGPLLRARLASLDDLELQLAFQYCSAVIQALIKRVGVFEISDYWLKELEASFVECNYEKWSAVCRWM